MPAGSLDCRMRASRIDSDGEEIPRPQRLARLPLRPGRMLSRAAIPFEPMAHSIAHLALVVRDYDEAIAWFTGALRFTVLEDTPLGGGKRWVVVAPPGSTGASLLLARAVTPEQRSRIGDQTGGRVFLFLHTRAFADDYAHMRAYGVDFTEEPRQEPYGRVVVFRDLYGNKWDLVERDDA
jgi:catechol 2,3-dioxygenase-like lactoylglutathione lyase family enzyme